MSVIIIVTKPANGTGSKDHTPKTPVINNNNITSRADQIIAKSLFFILYQIPLN